VAVYRELTGRDPGTARAAPDSWTDDDLGAAADALIDWYCDGRRTDDPALGGCHGASRVPRRLGAVARVLSISPRTVVLTAQVSVRT
jgi:hypothetical protein